MGAVPVEVCCRRREQILMIQACEQRRLTPAGLANAVVEATRVIVLLLLFGANSSAYATTLEEMYDRAGPGGGYDRQVILETGVTYIGGLWIGGTFNRITAEFEQSREDVQIIGNGAVLDLQGQEICIAYCTNRLDIEDCVIVNGNIKYRGYHDGSEYLVPQGSVRYVTFYQAHDYGVRLFGSGQGVLVERCIVVDAIDTGFDFMYLSGEPSPWMPTGLCFGLSMQGGGLELYDNWTYHTDSKVNGDLLRHFTFL